MLLLSYITERLTLLPLRDNLSESWENDVAIISDLDTFSPSHYPFGQ